MEQLPLAVMTVCMAPETWNVFSVENSVTTSVVLGKCCASVNGHIPRLLIRVDEPTFHWIEPSVGNMAARDLRIAAGPLATFPKTIKLPLGAKKLV